MKKQDRISSMMKELRQFWEQHPDWRLGQIISNLSYEVIGENDPFHLDDTKLIETLKIKNGKEKICKNCGKPFVYTERADQYYCTRPSPQNPKYTCAEIGPKLAYQDRYHNDSDWYGWYRKTYQLVQGRVRRSPKKYKSKLFEDFKHDTRQWIENVKKGEKTSDEFIQWLKQYREGLRIEKTEHKKGNATLSYEDKIISELTEKDLEV